MTCLLLLFVFILIHMVILVVHSGYYRRNARGTVMTYIGIYIVYADIYIDYIYILLYVILALRGAMAIANVSA